MKYILISFLTFSHVLCASTQYDSGELVRQETARVHAKNLAVQAELQSRKNSTEEDDRINHRILLNVRDVLARRSTYLHEQPFRMDLSIPLRLYESFPVKVSSEAKKGVLRYQRIVDHVERNNALLQDLVAHLGLYDLNGIDFEHIPVRIMDEDPPCCRFAGLIAPRKS